MKKLSLVFCLLLLVSIAFAQDQKHTIDVTLENCMDKNPSTHGTIGCIVEAQKQWDAELNKQYKALTLKLTPAQKTALLNAQREWIKWRDLEYKSIDVLYSTMEGTMYQPMQLNDKMKVVKNRALELRSYLILWE